MVSIPFCKCLRCAHTVPSRCKASLGGRWSVYAMRASAPPDPLLLSSFTRPSLIPIVPSIAVLVSASMTRVCAPFLTSFQLQLKSFHLFSTRVLQYYFVFHSYVESLQFCGIIALIPTLLPIVMSSITESEHVSNSFLNRYKFSSLDTNIQSIRWEDCDANGPGRGSMAVTSIAN